VIKFGSVTLARTDGVDDIFPFLYAVFSLRKFEITNKLNCSRCFMIFL